MPHLLRDTRFRRGRKCYEGGRTEPPRITMARPARDTTLFVEWRGERPDRDPELRAKYIKGRGGDRDRREPDPNSPFAKLAALKEQLEAGNKESR